MIAFSAVTRRPAALASDVSTFFGFFGNLFSCRVLTMEQSYEGLLFRYALCPYGIYPQSADASRNMKLSLSSPVSLSFDQHALALALSERTPDQGGTVMTSVSLISTRRWRLARS
jgi:hypothetical protein